MSTSDPILTEHHETTERCSRNEGDEKGNQMDSSSDYIGLMAVDKFLALPPLSDSDPRGVLFCYEFYRADRQLPFSRRSTMEKLDVSRWQQASRVYIVMMDCYQLGLARRLDNVPHYQVGMGNLQEFVRKLLFQADFDPGKLTVVGKNSRLADDNVCIINSPTELFQNNWKAACNLLDLSVDNLKPDKRQQRVYVDIGYTSGVSTSRRNGCPWGLARPNLRSLTRSPEGLAVMGNTVAISDAVDAYFPGRLCPPTPCYQSDFLSQHGGSTASSRVARTDGSSICGAHCDFENGNTPVLWAAKLTGKERLVQICYDRKSILDYYNRLNQRLPYLRVCREALLEIPVHRLCFTNATVLEEHGAKAVSLSLSKGLSLMEIPCNMDVTAFYQPFVSVMYQLHCCFGLDMAGACSVLCAMTIYSYSAIYPLVAAQILIHKFKRLPAAKDVGFTLLLLMDTLERRGLLDNTGKKFRFNRYRCVHAHRKEAEWRSKTAVLASTMVQVGSSNRDNKGLVQKDYDNLVVYFMKHFPHVGELKANHALGIAACVGLLPLEALGMIKGGACRFYSRMKTACPELPPRTTVLRDLGGLLEALLEEGGLRKEVPREICVSQRYTENVACKVGRILTNSDPGFVDIINMNFPLLSVRQMHGQKKENSMVLFVPEAGKSTTEVPIDPMFRLGEDGELKMDDHFRRVCDSRCPRINTCQLVNEHWGALLGFVGGRPPRPAHASATMIYPYPPS